MVREGPIIHNTRTLLGEFLAPPQAQGDRPWKRFLLQAVRGILFSGTLVMMELCRRIRGDCSDRFYHDKRLWNHPTSPRGALKKAVPAYRRHVARQVQPDTPLRLDPTDPAKPRAKKRKYLGLVRDGRTGTLVHGYGWVEVYAHLPPKRMLPAALEVYRLDDPAVGSQNLQIERVVGAVHDAGGPRRLGGRSRFRWRARR